MRKFRFPHEFLLKLRKRRLEGTRQDFSQAAGEVEALTSRLEKLRVALRVHNQALGEMLQSGADPMNLRLYSQCIHGIEEAIDDESRKLLAAQGVLRARQDELLGAARDRKAVDMLRDRQAAEHAVAERSADGKAWDELNAASVVAGQAADDRMVV